MIVASRLSARWKFVWGRLDAEVRRHVGPFVDYLNKQGIEPHQVTQQHFDDWRQTRAEGTANTVGHFNTVVGAWSKLRGLDGHPLPAIARLKNIHDVRAEENAAIDPGLLRDIAGYKSYLEGTVLDAATASGIERRLLDAGRILTKMGWSAGSFAEAFASNDAVKRFIAFFEPDPQKRTVIRRRNRIMGDIRDLLLQAGSDEAYERLTRYKKGLPKGNNALAEKTLDRVTVADAAAVLETSADAILVARHDPNFHNLAAARGGLAILAVSADSCRRSELTSLSFAGPVRTFGHVTRPALVFETHGRRDLVDLEDDGTHGESSLSILVNAYWVAARIFYKTAPTYVFANPDGSLQDPTTITNAVTRVTRRAGVALSPTDAIALNVDALFDKCGVEDWEIADLLRYSGKTNFLQRFRVLLQRKAARRAAADADRPS